MSYFVSKPIFDIIKMEKFGWEIVKEIINTPELFDHVLVQSDIKKGYQHGWKDGIHNYVCCDELYSPDESMSYRAKPDENVEPGLEESSQAYKFGYTLAANDCSRLHQLGISISRKLFADS